MKRSDGLWHFVSGSLYPNIQLWSAHQCSQYHLVTNAHKFSPMPPRRNSHALPQPRLHNACPALPATRPRPLRRRRGESTVPPPRRSYAASTRKVARKMTRSQPLQSPLQPDALHNQLMPNLDSISSRIFRASGSSSYLYSFLILKLFILFRAPVTRHPLLWYWNITSPHQFIGVPRLPV